MADESVIDVWRVCGDAHGALRAILASHLDCEPRQVRFEHGPHGKPFVSGGPWFSLSHSGPEALVAVSRDRPVGVDVERVRPDRRVERIARRRFARREADAIAALAPGARAEAFHACWTAKEAYAKGVGAGLGLGLETFSVAGLAGRAAVRVGVEHPARRAPGWEVQRLAAPAGYAAAVAAPGPDWRPEVREYRRTEDADG